MKEERENINGILLINKPKNYTSHDIINMIRKELKIKKVGHTGTLDPIAEGLMIILLGKCTKLSDFFTFKNKEYIAKVKIGIKTDTLDITGDILETKNQKINKKDLVNALKYFEKTYYQEVPTYSAVKIRGKKLYEYARNNEKIELPKRQVTINTLELLEFNVDSFTFKCNVSKGTYIRSLINDICNYLNVIGTMESLLRTKQDEYDIKYSYSLEDINSNNYKIIDLKTIFKDYPIIKINENEFKYVKNGNILNKNISSEYCNIIYKSKLIAIYKKNINNISPLINLIN